LWKKMRRRWYSARRIGAMAPDRKKDLAKLVTKAMFGGAIASWLTATIAGLLL
jgi:Nucleoside permease